MVQIDDGDGEIAVAFARSVLDRYVGDGTIPDLPTAESPLDDRRGAFVTLVADDRLRGCIGRPYPDQTGFEAIRESAIGAATDDPRFRPVERRELSDITVEVSVLGTPEPIPLDGDSVEQHVRVGRDGLLVSGARRSGLLLPQVAMERDWTASTFLAQTCRKAGLPEDCWREDDVSVERFTAEVFVETTPGGTIERVDLREATLV